MNQKTKEIIVYTLFVLLFIEFSLFTFFKYLSVGSAYYYIQLIVSLLLLLMGCCTSKRGAALYIIMSVIALFALSRQNCEDGDYYKENYIRLISFIPFFFLNRRYFKPFVIAACTVFLPLCLFELRVTLISNIFQNRYALHIVPTSLLLITYMVINKCKQRTTLWIAFALLIPPVLFHSRTAAIAFVAGIALFLYVSIDNLPQKQRKKRIITIVVLASVVLFLFQSQVSNFIFSSKYGDLQGEGQFITLLEESRGGMFDIITSMDLSWWGMGESITQDLFGVANIHNGYLQSYISFGIVFAVLYITLLVYAIILLIRYWKYFQMKVWSVLYIPMLIQGYSESNFLVDPDYPYIGLVLLLGISMIAQEARRIEDGKMQRQNYKAPNI